MSPQTQSPQNHRILAVDDMPDNLFMLQTLLELEGYAVEVATSGKTALNQIQTSPPDLVLLDMMMPEMSGIEVIHRIRRDAKFAELPVLLITANQELNADAIESQPNGVIHKPIDFDELLTQIKAALRSRSEAALV
jgi:CheY-like chemotaxis protein